MHYEKEFSQEPKAIWGFLFRARYSTDSQPEIFHLFLAPWSTAMTKKWNKALPEIENFKLPCTQSFSISLRYFFQASILILESNHLSISVLPTYNLFAHLWAQRLLAPNKCFSMTRWSNFCASHTTPPSLSWFLSRHLAQKCIQK